MDASGIECVRERFNDVFLPDHILKFARTPFTSENLMRHRVLIGWRIDTKIMLEEHCRAVMPQMTDHNRL
jgi:hypothetical protein